MYTVHGNDDNSYQGGAAAIEIRGWVAPDYEAPCDIEPQIAAIAANPQGVIVRAISHGAGPAELIDCTETLARRLGLEPGPVRFKDFMTLVSADDLTRVCDSIRLGAETGILSATAPRLIGHAGQEITPENILPGGVDRIGEFVWISRAPSDAALDIAPTSTDGTAAGRRAFEVRIGDVILGLGERASRAAVFILEIGDLDGLVPAIDPKSIVEIFAVVERRLSRFGAAAGHICLIAPQTFAIFCVLAEMARAEMARFVFDDIARPVLLAGQSVRLPFSMGVSAYRPSAGMWELSAGEIGSSLVAEAEAALLSTMRLYATKFCH